jgi:fructose-bisphosphate aldolase class I
MQTTVSALLAPGRGILAADESFSTIGKRFAALDIPSTEDNRRAYRELLFTTAGLGEFISGAILFDETIHQATTNGASMSEVLGRQSILPGIKVDAGKAALPGFDEEMFTLGFDGLKDRLAEYRKSGARFTKWRAVISIGEGRPTRTCIESNAASLALFAALSQEANLVPIVEPEVLMEGFHTLALCEEVTGAVLRAVFAALSEHRVSLESMLLKSGMVLSGKDCTQQADDAQVAEATLRCFRRTVPAAVPGIVFLSGGQNEVAATQRLNAVCRIGGAPWALSFSFGRALQNEALKTWKGSPANVPAAQAALLKRAHCNSLALRGKYSPHAESGAPDQKAPV